MRWRTILACAAMLPAVPAAAQVQIVFDGRPQLVPAGVVRTITQVSGGRQTIRDEPFAGAVVPGAATITTTETTDEDDRGRIVRTEIVTRIEPVAMTAYAVQQPAYAPQPYAPPAPHLDTDATAWADPGEARPLRLHRDPLTGHFITALRINGVAVRAIVDTGAQQTVLSAQDARATGADHAIVRATPMAGIGGMTMLNVAQVRSAEIGGQQLGGFTACIGQEGIPYTLLGQTEIARLGRVVIEDGVMTITPRHAQVAMRAD